MEEGEGGGERERSVLGRNHLFVVDLCINTVSGPAEWVIVLVQLSIELNSA